MLGCRSRIGSGVLNRRERLGGATRLLQRATLPLLLVGGSLSAVLGAALPASAAVATISFASGFTPGATSDVEHSGPGLSTTSETVTMPSAYQHIGDLAVLIGHYNTGTEHVTSIAGTGETGTWTLREEQFDTTINNGDGTTGKTTDVWTAPVTSTSSPEVLTINYSGSGFSPAITTEWWPLSLTAGLTTATSTVWSFPTAGGTNDAGTSLSINYANLTANTLTAQAYIGVAGVTQTATGHLTMPTPNFTYVDSTNSGNEIAYDLALSPGQSYAPTSTANPTSLYSTASVIVAAESTQTITFTAPSTGSVGASSPLTPSSNSALTVGLTVDGTTTNSACSLTGNTVNYLHVGNCVLDANQAGNADYVAATQVQRTIAVGKTTQTITFTTPASGIVGLTAALTPTASSGLAVTLTVDTATTNAACSLTGNTVNYRHVGNCVLDANQAGDATRLAATQVQHTIPVAKAVQTITFSGPGSGGVGATSTLTATTSSGLAVTFAADAATTNGSCSVAGSTVSFLHVGNCVIDATQAGDGDHNAATQVQQLVSVGKGSVSVVLKFAFAKASIGHENADRISVMVPAKSNGTSPTGKITIKIGSAKLCTATLRAHKVSCSLSPSRLKLGRYRVLASYSGNSDFNSGSARKILVVAEPATITGLGLSVGKVTVGREQAARLSVSVSPRFGGPAPLGIVTIVSSKLKVCTISLSRAKGSCTLAAKQLKHGTYHLVATYSGSAKYSGSSSAKKTLTVK